MPSLDTDQLVADTLAAVKAALTGHWNAVAPFAEAEMRKLAVTAAQIEAGHLSGTISAAQAKILLKMQANASQAALTAVETVGMIAAQHAINAALAVVKKAINAAIGIPLV
jgi:hypothetical protein